MRTSTARAIAVEASTNPIATPKCVLGSFSPAKIPGAPSAEEATRSSDVMHLPYKATVV